MKTIQLVYVFILIAAYHLLLQNGLEKILVETYFDYNDVKRPLHNCVFQKNGTQTKCIGMPSGHSEAITILALLLYLYKFISLPVCIALIIIFSVQRIVCNMHTFRQVIVGILLGCGYVSIYNMFHLSLYSFIIIFVIGFLLASLSIYKIDNEIHGPVPNWVDKNMLSSIEKKQNVSFYSKVGSIYVNALLQNKTFITWKQLEKSLDIIVDKIKLTGKQYHAVVGIKTGGAILSDYISKKLGIANYKIKLSRSEYNCDKKENDVVNDIIQKGVFKNYGQYTICEPIHDNLAGKNIILVDELVSSGKTMLEAYNYLQNVKNANDVYPVSVALENKYKGNLHIENVINGWVLHRPKRKMRQTHPKFRWLEALPSVKSTDGLTFSFSFLVIEEVKDEIQNSLGLCCL